MNITYKKVLILIIFLLTSEIFLYATVKYVYYKGFPYVFYAFSWGISIPALSGLIILIYKIFTYQG
jgi:hypothetical protein